MVTRVLVVDDDFELCVLLRDFLGTMSIEVAVLHDAGLLGKRLTLERPDLIVLDLLMPGVDGLTALRRLRDAGDDIPVIILTARGDEVERIVGLDMGADDYVAKPFNPRELLARMRAVLRCHRSLHEAYTPAKHKPLTFGRFTLDFQSRVLYSADNPVVLSSSEYTLLKIFVHHPMQTLSRERLLALLYGNDDHTDRGIDVQVWRLRRILEANPPAPRFIQTVRGCGYIFVPAGECFDEANR